jgi:hypothetical protein
LSHISDSNFKKYDQELEKEPRRDRMYSTSGVR